MGSMGPTFANPLALPLRKGGTSAGGGIGSISFFDADPGPKYLRADGSVYSQTAFPQLFAKIGLQGPLENSTALAAVMSTSMIWRGVSYGNGLFVAIGSTTTYNTSSDGINWTARVLPFSTGSAGYVTFTGGLFFITTLAAQTNVLGYMSADGINWTTIPFAGSVTWTSITYGKGLYLATYGGAQSTVYTSADGINWTPRSLPASFTVKSSAFGNGLFVLVGASGNTCMYSQDGIAWTQGNMIVAASWGKIMFGNGLFCLTSGTYAAVSKNGADWTSATLPLGIISDTATCFGDGYFYAPSYTGDSAFISTNGLGWVRTKLPAAQAWTGSAYGKNMFVTLGSASASTAYARLPRFNYDVAIQFAAPLVAAPDSRLAYIKAA